MLGKQAVEHVENWDGMFVTNPETNTNQIQSNQQQNKNHIRKVEEKYSQ